MLWMTYDFFKTRHWSGSLHDWWKIFTEQDLMLPWLGVILARGGVWKRKGIVGNERSTWPDLHSWYRQKGCPWSSYYKRCGNAWIKRSNFAIAACTVKNLTSIHFDSQIHFEQDKLSSRNLLSHLAIFCKNIERRQPLTAIITGSRFRGMSNGIRQLACAHPLSLNRVDLISNIIKRRCFNYHFGKKLPWLFVPSSFDVPQPVEKNTERKRMPNQAN